MLDYNEKTKIYKCEIKSGKSLLLREEHLQCFEDEIVKKEFIGNLVEIKPIIYDNMFYTD